MKKSNAVFFRFFNSLKFMVVGLFFLGVVSCSMMNEQAADDGQCWSLKGGVGQLIKNSSTLEECEELGGKSWCRVGGGCQDIP